MATIQTQILVLGAGPGGYAAAFYAADLGKKVVLVEKDKRLGGVCLNQGCIPSKALLHATGVMTEAKESGHRGIVFAEPTICPDTMRAWKNSILDKLGEGIRTLAQKRNIQVLQGMGQFADSRTLLVETADGMQTVAFEKAIIATGSRPALPRAFDIGDKRVMTSTEALEMDEIPGDLLVIGGGYIGMELGTVYAALGSKVVLVEALDRILTGVDADLVRPVMRMAQKRFREIRLNTQVGKIAMDGKRLKMDSEAYDRVLVATGRVPNSQGWGLEKTRATTDAKGFIQVDARLQTADPAIFAIGDVVGGAMLAHKASKEARIAVEAIAGKSGSFENVVIPAVVFTDPEIAWCGLTEDQAREKEMAVEVVRFPWAASGRAVSLDRTEGVTKLIIDPKTEKILGLGITGPGAGELIGEGVLAMQTGATARDLAHSVHPHPTLSETLMEAAELFYGSCTHALNRKKAVS